MRLRSKALAVAIAGAMLMTAGCGGSQESQAAGAASTEPFTVHALLALSGNFAAIGQAMAQGAQAAVDVINANGGVFGQPMKLEVVDTTSVPTEAVAKAQQLVSEGKVKALIPGTASNEISAVVPVVGPRDVLVIHHGAGISQEFLDTKKYPRVFGTVFQPPDQAESLAAEFAAKGFRKVAVVSTDNVAGHAAVKAYENAFTAKGISLTPTFVPDNAVDATAQMQQAVDSSPDVLLLDTYGAVTGPVLQARTKLGVTIPTYGSQYVTANNLDKLVSPSDLDGITLQALAVGVKDSNVAQTDAFKTFHEAVTDVTGGQLTFTMNTYLTGYNDVVLAANAARLAGSADANAMAKAIENASAQDLPFWVGPTDFSAERHIPTFGPEFWSFVPYGPTQNGLLVPRQQ